MSYYIHRLPAGVFLGEIIEAIATRTGTACVDSPENVASPLYAVELLATEPANTKTMLVDRFDVRVHCIAAPVTPHSNAPALRMEQALTEAMDSRIELNDSFKVFRQEYNGIKAVKKDPSGEGHVVTDWAFYVCYGYKVKN